MILKFISIPKIFTKMTHCLYKNSFLFLVHIKDQLIEMAGIPKPTMRLKHIELLNVVLTWLVLYRHAHDKYTTRWLDSDYGIFFRSISRFISGFFMEMFFFLAGINSFLSLNRYKQIIISPMKWSSQN